MRIRILAGQYFDQETGLHYNYHRYYDPMTGRYLTPDPIGLAGGINPFVYAEQNPINSIDPLGLKVTVFSRPVASSNKHHLFAAIQSPGVSKFELLSLAGIDFISGGKAKGHIGNNPLPKDLVYYQNHLARNISLNNYELPIPAGMSECKFDEKFKRAFISLLSYAEKSYPPLSHNYLDIQGLVNSNSIIDMAAELSGSPLPIFPNAPLQKSRPPKLNGRMDYRENFSGMSLLIISCKNTKRHKKD